MALDFARNQKPFRPEKLVHKNVLSVLSTESHVQKSEPVGRAAVKTVSRQASSHPFEPLSVFSSDSLPGTARSVGYLRISDEQYEYPSLRRIAQEKAVNQRIAIPSINEADRNRDVDALLELDEIDQESEEEGLPPRSEISKQHARRIVCDLASWPISVSAVYPTQDGEVAILFQKPAAKAAVLILCGSDGGAACFSNIGGKKKRVRYDDANDLPDAFFRQELLRLRVA